jgi:hypothetical protein
VFIYSLRLQIYLISPFIRGATPAIVEQAKAASLQAYAQSFKYIWVFEIPFVVLGLIGKCPESIPFIRFSLKPFPLSGILCLKSVAEYMTAEVDRPTKDVHIWNHAGHHHVEHEGQVDPESEGASHTPPKETDEEK